MRFTKMHGAGNDYVYVDCFAQSVPEDAPDLARRIADRHFGVGGDGLILIRPSDVADARMQMFNADGSEAEMCGNGVRCVAKYVYDHGISRKNQLRIETGAGVLTLDLELARDRVERVRVDMGEPILEAARVPTTLPGDPVVDAEITVAGQPAPRHVRVDGQSPRRDVCRSIERPLGARDRPRDGGRSALPPPGERGVRRGPVAR